MRRKLGFPALLAGLSVLLTPVAALSEGAPTPVADANVQASPVTVRPFADLKVFPRYSAPATVLSLNDSRVSAEITGTIKKISVRPGDTVDAGTDLVMLDCRDHELNAQIPAAQLQAAHAEKELADYRLERAGKLRKRGAMALEAFQQRKAASLTAAAEVRRLDAQVADSQRAVQKRVITAPFPAVVGERLASVGELARPGTPLLRLVDIAGLEVSSQIQEQDLISVEGAGNLEFVSRGQQYPLRLRSVVPVLDRRISSFEVRFELSDDRPAPGQSGRIRWRDEIPYVPANLLVTRDKHAGIFVVDGDQARFEPLPDAQPGQPAAAGLSDSAQLIVDGRFSLTSGQRIRVVSP